MHITEALHVHACKCTASVPKGVTCSPRGTAHVHVKVLHVQVQALDVHVDVRARRDTVRMHACMSRRAQVGHKYAIEYI